MPLVLDKPSALSPVRARRAARRVLPRQRLTAEEFLRLPLPEAEKWELVEGEPRLSHSPQLPHQRLLRQLLVVLADWLAHHPIGEVLADWDIKFLLHETRRPDLVVVLKQGSRCKLGMHGEGAPDLVVEILSPGDVARDLGEKRELYERCGVREYWVVDYEQRRVHQFLPDTNGRYVESVLTRGTLKSRLLAGFTLRLRELFKVLDELPR